MVKNLNDYVAIMQTIINEELLPNISCFVYHGFVYREIYLASLTSLFFNLTFYFARYKLYSNINTMGLWPCSNEITFLFCLFCLFIYLTIAGASHKL